MSRGKIISGNISIYLRRYIRVVCYTCCVVNILVSGYSVASENYGSVESIMDTYFNTPTKQLPVDSALERPNAHIICASMLNFCVPCSGSAREAWWPQMDPTYVRMSDPTSFIGHTPGVEFSQDYQLWNVSANILTAKKCSFHSGFGQVADKSWS